MAVGDDGRQLVKETMRGKRPLVFLMVAVMAIGMFAAAPAAASSGDECSSENVAVSDRGGDSFIDRSGVEDIDIDQDLDQENSIRDLVQASSASAGGPGDDVAVAANSANVGQSNTALQDAC